MKIESLLTHPDKIFWPDEGYNKLDTARFYEAVFPRLKPYVADRLLTMERCPEGMRDCPSASGQAQAAFPGRARRPE